MAFQYTDEGLIIVYSKKEQVEKVTFTNYILVIIH